MKVDRTMFVVVPDEVKRLRRKISNLEWELEGAKRDYARMKQLHDEGVELDPKF